MGQKIDAIDMISSLSYSERPIVPRSDQNCPSERLPEPVQEWNTEVRLYRKLPSRGLDPARFADTKCFVGHGAHVGPKADVLDNGVRMHQIDRLVREAGKIAGIPNLGREDVFRRLSSELSLVIVQ